MMVKLLKSVRVTLTISMSLSLPVIAHMQMIWPIPFNSIEDPSYYGDKVDYSMTSPLLADGSNYPCKGYQNEGLNKIQATYIAGQTYNLTLAGTATHDGGSCQISLSYDNGQSFYVIKSMIGGCPLTPTWDFQIPDTASSSNFTLLAWTWFNLVGNREMYMNCARVAVQQPSSSRKLSRARMRRQGSTDASIEDLPNNFACNIDNGCQTIEDHELIFPNPGPVIQIGQDAISASAGPGYTITGPTPTGDAFSTGPVTAASNTNSAKPQTTTNSISSPVGNLSTATTSPSLNLGTTRNPSTGPTTYSVTTTITITLPSPCSAPITSTSAAPTIVPDCTPGAIRCDSPTTWSQCVPTVSGGGAWISMGSVAPGTSCSQGVIGSAADF